MHVQCELQHCARCALRGGAIEISSTQQCKQTLSARERSLRVAMLRPVLPLMLLGLSESAASPSGSSTPAAASEVRLPLELDGEFEVKRSAGEPPFSPGKEYSCVFGRAGQFSLHMPPQNYHNLGVHTTGRGTATDADTLVCTVPRVVTAGNTTVCVVPPNTTRTHFPAFRPMGALGDHDRPAVAELKQATCGVTPCECRSECTTHAVVTSVPRVWVLSLLQQSE